jgi:hypothetical protein
MRVNEEREKRRKQGVTSSTVGSQPHLTKRHTTVKDGYGYVEIHNALHIVSSSLRFISLHFTYISVMLRVLTIRSVSGEVKVQGVHSPPTISVNTRK